MSVETVVEHDVLTQDTSALTHIVNCPMEKESAQAWVDEARAKGLEVTALCGHRWVPTRDPIRHPVCQACMDVAAALVAGSGS